MSEALEVEFSSQKLLKWSFHPRKKVFQNICTVCWNTHVVTIHSRIPFFRFTNRIHWNSEFALNRLDSIFVYARAIDVTCGQGLSLTSSVKESIKHDWEPFRGGGLKFLRQDILMKQLQSNNHKGAKYPKVSSLTEGGVKATLLKVSFGKCFISTQPFVLPVKMGIYACWGLNYHPRPLQEHVKHIMYAVSIYYSIQIAPKLYFSPAAASTMNNFL